MAHVGESPPDSPHARRATDDPSTAGSEDRVSSAVDASTPVDSGREVSAFTFDEDALFAPFGNGRPSAAAGGVHVRFEKNTCRENEGGEASVALRSDIETLRRENADLRRRLRLVDRLPPAVEPIVEVAFFDNALSRCKRPLIESFLRTLAATSHAPPLPDDDTHADGATAHTAQSGAGSYEIAIDSPPAVLSPAVSHAPVTADAALRRIVRLVRKALAVGPSALSAGDVDAEGALVLLRLFDGRRDNRVSTSDIAAIPAVRAITTDADLLACALRCCSRWLTVSADGAHVRRRTQPPPGAQGRAGTPLSVAAPVGEASDANEAEWDEQDENAGADDARRTRVVLRSVRCARFTVDTGDEGEPVSRGWSASVAEALGIAVRAEGESLSTRHRDAFASPVLYDRGSDVTLTPSSGRGPQAAGDGSPAPAARPLRSQWMRRCFNCGSTLHALGDCPEDVNNALVAQSQSDFRRKVAEESPAAALNSALRYHLPESDSDQAARYAHLRPGVLSLELRAALGIGANEEPPYYERMRVHGYPPGHTSTRAGADGHADEREASHLVIHGEVDSRPAGEGQQSHAGTLLSASSAAGVQYGQPAPLFEYPGLGSVPVGPSPSPWANGRASSAGGDYYGAGGYWTANGLYVSPWHSPAHGVQSHTLAPYGMPVLSSPSPYGARYPYAIAAPMQSPNTSFSPHGRSSLLPAPPVRPGVATFAPSQPSHVGSKRKAESPPPAPHADKRPRVGESGAVDDDMEIDSEDAATGGIVAVRTVGGGGVRALGDAQLEPGELPREAPQPAADESPALPSEGNSERIPLPQRPLLPSLKFRPPGEIASRVRDFWKAAASSAAGGLFSPVGGSERASYESFSTKSDEGSVRESGDDVAGKREESAVAQVAGNVIATLGGEDGTPASPVTAPAVDVSVRPRVIWSDASEGLASVSERVGRWQEIRGIIRDRRRS